MTGRPSQALIEQAKRARELRVEAARKDPAYFCEFVLRDELTNEPIKLAKSHRRWHRLLSQHREIVIWGHQNCGKCETRESRVLLASGEWKHIDELSRTERTRVQMLDPSTMSYRVVEAGPVEENGVRRIIEVSLRSGRVLKLTTEHPLFTTDGWTRAEDLIAGQHLACARELPEMGAQFDPEEAALLGYLVGDGGLTRPSRVGFTNVDDAVLADVSAITAKRRWRLRRVRPGGIDYMITRSNGNGWHAAKSPSAWAREHGIACGAKEKRVPKAIFTADAAAVGAFVGAYFACDGYVMDEHRGLEFSSTSRDLLLDVQLLLLRLGVASRVKPHGNKAHRLFVTGAEHVRKFIERARIVGAKADKLRAYPAATTELVSQCDLVPGSWRKHLPRKLTAGDASRYKFSVTGDNHRTSVRRVLKDFPLRKVELLAHDAIIWDEIVKVREVAAEMTYALPVHDEAHCYLSSGVLSHNTHQIGIGRVLWELGHNPNLRVAIVSKTTEQAKKILAAIRQYLQQSDELRAVFPNLRIAKDRRLKNNEKFLTLQRKVIAKDPSIQVTGEKGNIVGSRVDLLYIDDLLDEHNTRTQAPRDTTWKWLRGNGCFGRVKRGRIWITTNAWHPQDCNERLVREAGFYGERFPILDERGGSTWPERWTMPEIDRMRDRILGEIEFQRAMLCKARDEDAAPFRPEWINWALERGRGRKLVASIESLAPDERPIAIYVGVDLAIEKKESADLTAFVATGVYSNGDRRILYIKGERMGAPEILAQIGIMNDLFPDAVWVVETVAAQKYILQILHATTAINAVAFDTGSHDCDKAYGLSKLGLEMANKKWIFPCDGAINEQTGLWVPSTRDRHMRALIAGLIEYDPTAHTSDYLIAMWLSREGAVRYGVRTTPTVEVTTFEETPQEKLAREVQAYKARKRRGRRAA